MSITAGILWCVEQGAKVVNLSLGGPATGWDGFKQAIGYGCRQGVDFAVAAGNDAWPHKLLNPATVTSPCLVAVNASDQHDRLTKFSNYYENPRTITAPGQVILSDWINGSVALGSGTSASAPFVAGVLALLRSQGADARQAVQILLSTARHPAGIPFVHGRNHQLGYGILDAAAACRMETVILGEAS
jgi:subtilisin family serine protease